MGLPSALAILQFNHDALIRRHDVDHGPKSGNRFDDLRKQQRPLLG